jgi:hypothetical protein
MGRERAYVHVHIDACNVLALDASWIRLSIASQQGDGEMNNIGNRQLRTDAAEGKGRSAPGSQYTTESDPHLGAPGVIGPPSK